MQIKFIYIIVFCLFTVGLSSQTKLSKSYTGGQDSSMTKKSKGFKELASIDMYLQFNNELDSIQVDTTLTIKKNYKFNYLQKDNFELMPFANIGQTYNTLSFDSWDNNTSPLFGARARHFNYFEHDDIMYYEVPTPWTRLTYKTAFEQGQLLDAFFTVNLSKQFNFSLAYKGLRSLGNYQNALTSTGNFRFTSRYKSKNERYQAKGYVVMQDLLNQENGGLETEDLDNFTSGIAEFLDRSVFDPAFEDAENILEGKRFYLEHSYGILQNKDSLADNNIRLFNKISLEDKNYQYSQTTSATSFFGDAFANSIKDKVKLEDFKTALGLNYTNNVIGSISLAVNYTDLNYGYNSIVLLNGETITNRIQSNYLGLEGEYSKTYKGFNLTGKGGLNLSDTFVGSYLEGMLNFKLNEDIALSGGLAINSRLPNYNYLLYQSDYINYNWYNLDDFSNVNTQQLKFNLKSEKWLNATLDLSNIDNYTYFNLEETIDDVKTIAPKQYNEPLQYLRLKLQKEFKIGNFALDNTIMYQNVVSDDDVLNVPAIITRNTLYYSNELFKKSMRLQTGVTFNYFSEYNMNGYDPLLAEFYTQNDTKLGGFPRLDFFITAKVRQTRIFFTAEHFNSSFTGYDYFSAPNNPYRDFTIRFGLEWDFFL
ncbi:putative porin [Winogradskyella psychrotolerans]|uniref:putative porin n=1 Tax=Winogradskyella psychrotolerans TaxID=1344585 RepID=UPI001C075608|nr:putative porin [Winogradskyella psychrotolerans]MBU2929271.1 putative porin [Winogradskyella psychrotolerans]